MSNTFYNFKLDLEPNLIDMIYDILRMSTIQLVTQIMFYMNNSSCFDKFIFLFRS